MLCVCVCLLGRRLLRRKKHQQRHSIEMDMYQGRAFAMVLLLVVFWRCCFCFVLAANAAADDDGGGGSWWLVENELS